MATKNTFGLGPLERIEAEYLGLGQPLQDASRGIAADQAQPQQPEQPMPQVDTRQPTTFNPGRGAGGLLPPTDFVPMFESAARKYNVPVNVIMALGQQESSYNPHVRGVPTKYGQAAGLMQYLPSTAKMMGINPFDAGQSIDAAAKQIRQRLDNGYSMEDAVKEHFAGPNRKLWGAKTAQYGIDVLGKAKRIGAQLWGEGYDQAPGGGVDEFNSMIQRDGGTQGPMSIKADGPMSVPPGTDLNDIEGIARVEKQEEAPPSYESRNWLERYVTDRIGSGWKGLQAGVAGSAADFNARIIDVIDRIDRGESVPDKNDPLGYQYMDPQQRESAKKYMGESFINALGDISKLKKEQQAIPQHPEVAAALKSKTFGEFWEHFTKAPMTFIANVGVESAPAMAPGLLLGGAVGVATRAAGGFAAGMGAGSYAVDYQSSVLEALQEAGVDMSSQESLQKAFQDKTLMEQVRKLAGAHAAAVGTFDALSGGVAGKTLVKGAGVGRRVANAGAQMPVQGALGAAGEAGGQLAQGKSLDELEAGQIGAEFFGEMATAPIDVAAAGLSKRKDTAPQPRTYESVDERGNRVKWQDPAPQQDAAPAAPAQEAPTGPLGRAMQAGEEAAVAQSKIAPEGMPPVGATVLLAPEGVEPISVTIDAYIGADVSVRDQAGNAMQIPIAEAAQAMQPIEQAQGTIDPDTGEVIQQGEQDAAIPEADAIPDERGPGIDDAQAIGGNQPQAVEVDVALPGQREAVSSDTDSGVREGMADADQQSKPKPALKTDYSKMTLEQLQERQQYLVDQARINNGWNKPLSREKGRIESAIKKLQPVERATAAQPPQVSPSSDTPAITPRETDITTPQGKPLVELFMPSQGVHVLVRKDHWEAGQERLPAFNRGGTRATGSMQNVPRKALAAPIDQAAKNDRAEQAATVQPDGVVEPDVPESAYVDGNSGAITQPNALETELEAARAAWAQSHTDANGKRLREARAAVAAKPQKGDGGTLRGEDIDGDWMAFAGDSGTLKIPRSDMPQIKAEHRGAMVNFLNARDIAHQEETVPASSLKPTQAEFSRKKVGKAKGFEGGDRSILVSKDGHVLDGHHQWIARRDAGEDVKIIRLDAPIRKLLDEVRAFPSAETAPEGGAQIEAKQPEPIATPQKEVVTKPATKKPTAKQKAEQRRKMTDAYFEPGNIIESYGGGHDRVISYSSPDASGNWSVRVRAVQKVDGKWVDTPKESERTHKTQPDDRLLRKGPVDHSQMPQDAEPQAKAPVSVTKSPGVTTIVIDPSAAANPADQMAIKQETPAAPGSTADSRFTGNKIFTQDKVNAARARLKSKLGQINSGIDPETLIDGMTIAGAYIEEGARNFTQYAQAMVEDLGDGIKPYLLSFWEGARNYPGLNTEGMTDAAESKRQFDALITPADAQTEAVGVIEKKPATRTRKVGKATDRTLVQDWGVDNIDGWTHTADGQGDPTDFGLSGGVKDAFLKDARTYLNAVSSALTDIGYTAHTDAKGRPMKPVSVNEAGPAVSGDVSLTLAGPDGVGAYVTIGAGALRGMTPSTASGIAIMYRAAPNSDKFGVRGQNHWSPVDLSAADLAAMIDRTVSQEAKRHGTEKLDQPSPRALERAPADQIQGTATSGQTRPSAEDGSRADAPRNERSGSTGTSEPRSLGNDQGALPVSETGSAGAGRDSQPGLVDDRADSGNELGSAGTTVTPPAGTRAEDRGADFAIQDADEIGKGGAKTKFRNNIAAIQLLKQLEAENRPATRAEQAALAKYVGWGGIPQAFERSDGGASQGWTKEVAELKAALTPEEYRAAAASTRNAHYTSPEIVSAMWQAMKRLGFNGGKVLEPSVGVGNFFGLMPADMRQNAALHGVELDNITGGIAKHLYPAAKIASPMGFQDYTIPDGYFDAAIGNPPFGRESLYDSQRKDLSGFSIHNYFFAKSIDGLKPNGVMAMVVTNRMMDVAGDKARRYMADRAELVGAIRLPNNAFMGNAGTEVTTDILFFRKLAEGEGPTGQSWMDVVDYADKDGNTVPLNEYFVRNPDMMLGDFGQYGSMYSPTDPALVARPGQDTPALLAAAIAKLPENIATPAQRAPVEETIASPLDVANIKVGSAFMQGDAVMQREPDLLGEPQAKAVEFASDKARERIVGMIGVRNALTTLRMLQLDRSATDKAINTARTVLNDAYDLFVKDNGPLNLDANKRLFRDDPTWPQISALEESFDKGLSATVAKKTGEKARKPSAVKAAIFSKRTQAPYQAPDSAKTAEDALVTSLAETGRVDMDMMARLYGKPESQILSELGDLVFRDPVKGLVTRDEYLAGNVKAKLAQAKQLAATDPAYQRNIEALQTVQPEDVEAVDIKLKPGAHWVPTKHMADFADFISEGQGSEAFYNPGTARWTIREVRGSEVARQRFSTSRASLADVLNAVANQRSMSIYDRHSDGTRTINPTETQLANERAKAVRDEWDNWIWSDDARRTELSRLYNDMFNTDVKREFDGAHLTLPGKVGDDIVKLRPHQNNAVWRIIQSDTTLTDHVVGAGKTYTLVAGAMELRRMGLAKKPMFVVPNHLVGQWAADFNKLYPGANVLAASKRDFDKDNRKRLFARIATGDWDAVIVAHSSFGKVEVEPAEQAAYIEEQVADLTASAEALRESDGKGSRNVKQVEKQIADLREKIKKLLDAGSKDDSLYWGELGIDALFVDEFHEFKNLAYSTSMTKVAGLGSRSGSNKASDMFLKIRQVLNATGGRNVVTATGTPISNTMAEMFTLQRYLDYKNLKGQGLAHFDAWARQFGEVVTDWELSPSGQYKMNSRFAKFVNMPELMQRYTSFADVVNRDDINRMLASQGKTLPVPKMAGGKPENVVVERSTQQASYIGEPIKDADGNDTQDFPKGTLVWRAENLPKKAEKGADNMLKIMSDARKAALDMRLIDPSAPDYAGSKVNVAADRIVAIHKKWAADKGGQLVFIDLSTPKKAKGKEAERIRKLIDAAEAGDEDAMTALDRMSPDEISALESDFSVYDDLKAKLIAKGIPEAEIAFIHDANTELQKEELFGKVRSGRIRVLFGSTAKMGAGMNVQERLVALHHLDAPWRPSDLEQREGRIIRQGNVLYDADPEGFEVDVVRYATKQTLDSRMWQTIEGKARVIEQVRKGDTGVREIEDVGGEAANAAEMKAASSGNPLILEEMTLRNKMRDLEGERSGHNRTQFRLRDSIKDLERGIKYSKSQLDGLQKDIKLAQPKEFAITVNGQALDKRKEAGEAILAHIVANGEGEIGSYGGFKVFANGKDGEYDISLHGALEYATQPFNPLTADPQGVSQRIVNAVKGLQEDVDYRARKIEQAEKDLPRLRDQVAEWVKAGELAEVKARHAAVIDQLRPKKKEAPAAEQPAQDAPTQEAPDDGVRYSVAVEGGTLSPSARSTAALSKQKPMAVASTPAQRDIEHTALRDQMFGQLRDRAGLSHPEIGTIGVNRKGWSKSRANSTDRAKLLTIPKLPDIIQDGVYLGSQPAKGKSGVNGYHYVARRLSVDGVPLTALVTIEEAQNGTLNYYNHTILNDNFQASPTGKVDGLLASYRRPSFTPDGQQSRQDALPAKHRTVHAALTEGALGGLVDRLIGEGHITLHPSENSLPRSIQLRGGAAIQAYTDKDGKIHLVAESLTPQTAMPVVLHEAFHAGGERLIGTAKWNNLNAQLQRYYEAAQRRKAEGRVTDGDFWDGALRRVEAARKQGAISETRAVEEFGAYAIENYELAPSGIKKWIDTFLGMVKDWLARRFDIQAGAITPAQLRAFAVAALRNMEGTMPVTTNTVGGMALGGGALSTRQGDQTDTAAFKAWFKDSKVVDANGNPLVVYRGESGGDDFNVFNLRKTGEESFFFSPDESIARDYARGKDPRAFYLSAKNVLNVVEGSKEARAFIRQWADAWNDDGWVNRESGESIDPWDVVEGGRLFDYEGDWSRERWKDLQASIEVAGYDGAFLPDTHNGGLAMTSIVVFRPEQIKSATDNAGTFDPANPDIRYSVQDDASNTDAHPTESSIKSYISDKLTGMNPTIMATIPLNYFEELARPSMKAVVKAYMDNKRAMDAYRGRKHSEADETAQQWLKLRAFDRKDAQALAEVMHEATRTQDDPTDKRSNPPLRKKYEGLSANAKALYREVRDAYLDQSKELDEILIENVSKAMDLVRAQAERRYNERIQEIKDMGLKDIEKADAEAAALKTYRTATTTAAWSQKARVTKLRQVFESNRLDGPYFPLARFGQYFVTLRDVDGKVMSFSRRESVSAMNRLAKQLRQANPGMKVETGMLSNKSEVHGAMDPRFVAEVEEILSGASIDDDIKDQVWQRYLESMPDMSTRKRFIHRKGTEGFEQDALRSFSHHMFHSAHQMAKLKYGPEMTEQVNQVEDEAKKADDPVRAMQLSNELRKRHDWVMNPTGSRWSQAMTSTAFVWYLGLTPAAAIVNVSQTWLLGVPVIGAQFGVAKTTAALAKAQADFIAGKGTVAGAKLTPDEQAAMQAAYDSGLVDKSQAHDLAGVGETGVEYSAVRQKVMSKISWLFHNAEKMNREITSLAAYRLARDAGQSHEQAIDEAHALTWKTHFDYSNSNRPRMMQNDFAKTALVFRNFQINMLYRLFRDIHQSFKGETPQARKEARYQLAGIMGMMALNAGVKGMPFYSIAMILAGLAFSGDDDPFEFEDRFREDTMKILGPELGGIVMNGVPGHYLGVDLTNRIGMPDLWFRSPNRDLQGKDEYQYWLSQAIGATGGMFENLFRGVSIASDGHVARGIETAAPKAVKDVMKSWRYVTEGATTIKGESYIGPDGFSTWDIIAQAIGFTPAKLVETYEKNNALKNAEAHIKGRRKELLDRYNLARKLKDDDAKSAINEKIKEFNKAFPQVRITPQTKQQSWQSKRSMSRRTEDGIVLDKRIGRGLRREMAPYTYRD